MNFEKKFSEYDTIGEISLSLNVRRTASVIAYTEVKALYLDQKGYEVVFASLLENVKEKIKFFSDFFPSLKFDEVKRAAFLFEEQKFNINEILYQEGSFPIYLFFIKSGEVHVSGEGLYVQCWGFNVGYSVFGNLILIARYCDFYFVKYPINSVFIFSQLLRSNQEKATKPIEQVEDINDLKNKAKKTKVPKNLHQKDIVVSE